MDVNQFRGGVEINLVGVPSAAKNVRVLLVDPNTTSLMSLATRLETKEYKVTTTESAIVALAMLRERKDFYTLVLADYHMSEMSALVFVQKIHRKCPTMPILLMARDPQKNIKTEAICRGVCYFFTKPLDDRDLTDLWQHVARVTGKVPDSLNDSTNYYLDILRNKNLNDGSSGGAQNGKRWNSKKKSPMKQDRRKGKKRVSEDLSDYSHSDEEKENTKQQRMCWTPYLHAKFLKAIDILGEDKAYPKALLNVINEPGLTHRQVASHLQKHRDRKRNSSTPPAVERQVLPPIKLPAMNNYFQCQSTGPTVNDPPITTTPSSFCYSLENIKQTLDALEDTENNTQINNRGVSQGDGVETQPAQENGPGVQLVPGINPNHDNSNANAPWFSQNFSDIVVTGDTVIVNSNLNQKQVQEFSPNFGQVIMPSDNVISYAEQATGFTQNSSQVTMATIPIENQLINDSNILNQQLSNDFGMRLSAFENAGSYENFGEGTSGANQQTYNAFDGMSAFENVGSFENFGEGTSGANQQTDNAFNGMAGDYNSGDISRIIQDFDAYRVDWWNTL